MGSSASIAISAAVKESSDTELKTILASLPAASKEKLLCALGGEKKTVCVCGAGNAAHVFIPYFCNLGFNVTVFADFGDEVERLQKGCDDNGGILVHDRC